MKELLLLETLLVSFKDKIQSLPCNGTNIFNTLVKITLLSRGQLVRLDIIPEVQLQDKEWLNMEEPKEHGLKILLMEDLQLVIHKVLFYSW
mgnify:CR=1 FL=1